MDLEDLRDRIDQVDERLIALWKERMALCARVAQIKKQTGGPVARPEREKQILDRVTRETAPLDGYAREVYARILDMSRAYQEDLMREGREA